jgi:arsenate reductase
MAKAFARMAGIEAQSAGSRPSGKVNPKVIEAMKELDYDLTAHYSKFLDELPGETFDVAVTMGCGDACPTLKAPDPKDLPPDEFRKVRDLIAEKVKEICQLNR